MEKNIFIFDKNRCVGCHACIVACVNENGFQNPERWRNVLNSNPGNHPELPLFYLSLACNHCDDAPCLINCPANAFYHDPKTGAVIHEENKCIGCKYCSWVCPYDAPKFIPDAGVMEKCTFCHHRIEDGLKPSCASLCPTGALDFSREFFAKNEAMESSPVPLMIGSSLKVIELRNPSSPITDKGLFETRKEEAASHSFDKVIKAKNEWPLLVFTLISAYLVGIYSSALTHLPVFLSESVLILSGFLAGILSIFHLGKKNRAWRSVLNVENSWLSREILFFVFFLICIITDAFLWKVPKAIFIFNGILLLLSIDFLYLPAHWNWKVKIHSGQVIMIALSLGSILSGYWIIFLSISIIRILILFSGNTQLTKKLVILFILIISSYLLISRKNEAIGLLLLLLSDVLQRISFYQALIVPRPKLL